MSNTTIMRVGILDKKLMMKECKELFLKSHPDFKGMSLTQGFMFNKIVKFYLNA